MVVVRGEPASLGEGGIVRSMRVEIGPGQPRCCEEQERSVHAGQDQVLVITPVADDRDV